MKLINFSSPYSDEVLISWLDGEMDHADALKFETLLEKDAELAERVDELLKSQLNVKEAFAPLLDQAPEAKMQRDLERLLEDSAPSFARVSVSRRSLIAASLSFLVIGSGLGYLTRPGRKTPSESEKIRDLEAQYMSLYSAETLLDTDSSSLALQRGLTRTAQDIGLRINEQQITLPDAELKMVRMLRYDSTSIAQIAWIHADYGPMALCISADDNVSSVGLQREQRHDMHLVWWRHKGYQYVLIGRNPEQQSQSAQLLRTSLSA